MYIEFRLYSFVYDVKDYREHVMQFMNDINCIMSAGTKVIISQTETAMSLTYFRWAWYDEDRLIPLLCRPCIYTEY